MTPADIVALVRETPLPADWRIEPVVTRRYRWRNEWALVALCEGVAVRQWSHIYDVAGALPAVVAWIEDHAAATYAGVEVPVR